MHRAQHLFLPAILVAFGAVIMWESLTAMDYFVEARGAPGPGFLPFWLALGVILLGLVLIVRGALATEPDPGVGAWPDLRGWGRIGCVVAAFAVALLLLRPLGFLLTAILYVAVVGYALGERRPFVLVPVALVSGVVLYGLFAVWLRVSLPKGILSF